MMRRTKLIASIGPSSSNIELVYRMAENGVEGFRINYAHGPRKSHKEYISMVRMVEERLGKPLPIIGDIEGRTTRIQIDGELSIVKDREYILGVSDGIRLSNRDILEIIDVGDHILIDDGRIKMEVREYSRNNVKVIALNNGRLRAGKKVIVKGKTHGGEFLSGRDIENIKFSVGSGISYIALSMVRDRDDIRVARELMGDDDIWIISKIETPESVSNLGDIVRESDAIIVARGDLGQHFRLEDIPVIQRRVVSMCHRYGRISIVATQILESMISNDTPTRAEITDIYESVSQHVDGILLTGETSIGRYPVEVVKWASRILERADESMDGGDLFYEEDFIEERYDKFARGIIYISNLLNGWIIGFTRRGNTARRLSRYRPRRTIWIATTDIKVYRKMGLIYGVNPVYPESGDRDIMEILYRVKDRLIRGGLLSRGDVVIYVVGVRPEATDVVRLEIV